MKNIILIRHAKSSWKNMFLSDHDRPLNGRGKRNAPEMGKRLRSRDINPTLLLSSTAKRAHQTAKKIAKKIGFETGQIQLTEALFHANEESIFEIIKSLDDIHDTVMIFGHNPGITECANLLAGTIIINIPTCGVASIAFHCNSWSDLQPREGRMIYYDYPKKPEEYVR